MAEAERLGLMAYACVPCGGWHLTSNGVEAVRALSPTEQAVLVLAREGGAQIDDHGDCIDHERRLLPGSAAAVRALERKRMIEVAHWGEIVPRKGRKRRP